MSWPWMRKTDYYRYSDFHREAEMEDVVEMRSNEKVEWSNGLEKVDDDDDFDLDAVEALKFLAANLRLSVRH